MEHFTNNQNSIPVRSDTTNMSSTKMTNNTLRRNVDLVEAFATKGNNVVDVSIMVD